MPNNPDARRYLIASYALSGRLEEARQALARLRTVTGVILQPVNSFRNPEHRELLPSGLRLAMGGEE